MSFGRWEGHVAIHPVQTVTHRLAVAAGPLAVAGRLGIEVVEHALYHLMGWEEVAVVRCELHGGRTGGGASRGMKTYKIPGSHAERFARFVCTLRP